MQLMIGTFRTTRTLIQRLEQIQIRLDSNFIYEHWLTGVVNQETKLFSYQIKLDANVI